MRAASAAGQGGLISVYESMFAGYGVLCAQVLVTKVRSGGRGGKGKKEERN